MALCNLPIIIILVAWVRLIETWGLWKTGHIFDFILQEKFSENISVCDKIFESNWSIEPSIWHMIAGISKAGQTLPAMVWMFIPLPLERFSLPWHIESGLSEPGIQVFFIIVVNRACLSFVMKMTYPKIYCSTIYRILEIVLFRLIFRSVSLAVVEFFCMVHRRFYYLKRNFDSAIRHSPCKDRRFWSIYCYGDWDRTILKEVDIM